MSLINSVNSLRTSINTVLSNSAPSNSISPNANANLLLDIIDTLSSITTSRFQHNENFDENGMIIFDSYPKKLNELTTIKFYSLVDFSGNDITSLFQNSSKLIIKDAIGNIAVYEVGSVDFINKELNVISLSGTSGYEYQESEVVDLYFDFVFNSNAESIIYSKGIASQTEDNPITFTHGKANGVTPISNTRLGNGAYEIGIDESFDWATIQITNGLGNGHIAGFFEAPSTIKIYSYDDSFTPSDGIIQNASISMEFVKILQ